MIDYTQLLQLTEVKISLIILLFSSMFLYFGKFISLANPNESDDKLTYSILGLIFSALFIFLPFIVIYNLKDAIISVNNVIWMVILFIITVIISLNLEINFHYMKYGKTGKALTKIQEKIIVNWLGHTYVLIIFSGLIFSSVFSNYYSNDILLFLLSSVWALFILTAMAIIYGINGISYPDATIYIANQTPIEGKIVKYGKFIYVINKEEKKILINKDKIEHIEMKIE